MTCRFLFIFLLLTAMTLAACTQDREAVTGTYAGQNGKTEIILTLKDNGKGTWSTDQDEIQFKWSLRKGGKLWLHTREGGVIQGQIRDGKITLALPGIDELLLLRQ